MADKKIELLEIAESGDLAVTPFARVFYRFCREKRSGVLDVRDRPPNEGGRVLKRLMMVEGSKFAVQGGTPQETLPEIAREKGKLTPEAYDALKAEMKGDFGKMEQKILSGSVVAGAVIPELLSLQAELKVKMLFGLIRGHYVFKTAPASQIMGKHFLAGFSVEKAMLEGAIDHYPATRIKKEFPGIEKKLFRPAADLKSRITSFMLPPSVSRWLRGAPESFTWESLLNGAPVGQEQALIMLMSLYFAEVIVLAREDDDFPVGRAYLEARERAMQKKEEEAEKKEDEAKAKKEAKAKVEEEKKKEVKKETQEEPKLPIEEMLDKEMSDQELLKEIERQLVIAHDKNKTYFDVLGVKENTTSAKIKQVYFKFAKKFHPDAKPDLFQGEIKEQVEDLFTKVSEAYNAISDGEARKQYADSLKSAVSKEDMDKAQRAVEAEMNFQKAEVLLKRSAWAEAAELLDRSVQLQPDEPEYGLYLAWARYKLKGPAEASRAQKTIKQALDARPNAADGHYYLGQLAKDQGDLEKAESYFTKAAEMKPHDIDIKRELQLLMRRRSKEITGPRKAGLFGKKK